MRALGVEDHRFLGGVGRWRDSGMMGTPGNDDPRPLANADPALFDVAVDQAVPVIWETAGSALVTLRRDGAATATPRDHTGPLRRCGAS